MREFSILQGDVREVLQTLPTGSVHCCVTSPPYFGLRDYGTAKWEGGDPECKHAIERRTSKSTLGLAKGEGSQESARRREMAVVVPYRNVCEKCGARRIDSQIGLEETPAEYVHNLVRVFREVRRVLRDDGTLWLNLGDSYASTSTYNTTNTQHSSAGWKQDGRRPNAGVPTGFKPKDLMMIPARVALALQEDGWYLRSDIIWSKPNPMPESVTDRPTKAHEYLFLLAKSERYYYNADAIREEMTSEPRARDRNAEGYSVALGTGRPRFSPGERVYGEDGMRNKRSVWTVATEPYHGAHFATFPTALVEPCILAGCPENGTVLDPFTGSGTTGVVALRYERSFIGVELNPAYREMARARIAGEAPLLNVEISA